MDRRPPQQQPLYTSTGSTMDSQPQQQQPLDRQDDAWSDGCDSDDDQMFCRQGQHDQDGTEPQHEIQHGGGWVGLALAGGLLVGAAAAIGSGFVPPVLVHVDPTALSQSLGGGSDPSSLTRLGSVSRQGVRRPQSFKTTTESGGSEMTIFDPLGLSSADGDEDKGVPAPSSSSSSSGGEKPPPVGVDVDVIPPISELVLDEQVNGDISWMMDFAIIGNPKCGTTFLMHWLARNDDTFVHNGELCSLSQDKPHDIVNNYYDHLVVSSEENGQRKAQTSEGHRIKGGLKCPKEIGTKLGLHNWQKYFPQTDFIVTTRHPVLWFQSFYNYDAYGHYPKPIPHPNELIGACYKKSDYLCTDHCGHPQPGKSKVCTDRSNFHHGLSRLGKTPMSTADETDLLGHGMSIVPLKGRVFLMEISQLFPDNPASARLPEDVRDFLDLKYELRPLHERVTGSNRYEYNDKEKRKAMINICDDEFAPVREVLVQNGRESAQWIREYFMKSEDVVVSSPDLFVELLEKWGEDPCDALPPGRRLYDVELDL